MTEATNLLEEDVRRLREQIELIEDEVEILEEEIEAERRHPHRPRAHVVVDNQDDGSTVRFWAQLSSTVGAVVARVYEEFRLQREPGDRLTRVSDGQNVFASEGLTVEQYLDGHHHGHSLHWALRTDTGGA